MAWTNPEGPIYAQHMHIMPIHQTKVVTRNVFQRKTDVPHQPMQV